MVALASFALFGCSEREPLELVDHSAWAALPSDNPLAGLSCSSGAFSTEDDALEIQTDGCSPVAVGQVLREAIEEGDTLEIVWWHDWLFATEPADGVFALYVDGELLYEAIEAIPGPPAVFTESFEAPAGGTELVIQVDNHGTNTWNLLRLTRPL